MAFVSRGGNRPWIMGLSASHHNAACCVLHGDEVCVAIQEERLTGGKREGFSAGEATSAVPYCLEAAGIGPGDLDMVVLSTAGYPARDPRNDLYRNPLLEMEKHRTPMRVIPHHFGHAVSAYALSGFADASILVVDGLGSPAEDLRPDEQRGAVRWFPNGWEHISLYQARGAEIVCVEKHLLPDGRWLEERGAQMPAFATLGAMYSAVAQQIFGSEADAGKVMGLAPFGQCSFPRRAFFEFVGTELRFGREIPGHFCHADRWPQRQDEYANLAASVQRALEEAILALARRLKDHEGGSERLCYAGGVALNCTTNELLSQSGLFKEIFIPPAAEDSGVAIGAAYYGLWSLLGQHVRVPQLKDDGVGVRYRAADVLSAVADAGGGEVFRVEETRTYAKRIAHRLAEGEVCAWFQGASELGPRALGHRSLLADPRQLAMKTRLNEQMKGRESFRPLAPVVLAEEASRWFQVDEEASSPFMLRTWQVREHAASLIPAVLHVDGTARVQTLTKAANPWLHEVVSAFAELTGVPVLLNTSFNVAGEPIVESPEDALWTMFGLGADLLVAEGVLVVRAKRELSLLELVPRVCPCVTLPSNPLSAVETAILGMLDGRRTGWGVLGRLQRAFPSATELSTTRTLVSLRRKHLITFGFA